jgi:alkylation response protein AidB-like acyl-CoA dehydrogenase
MVDLGYRGLLGERRDISRIACDYLAKSTTDPTAGLELGWFGIGIDEAHGGSGGHFADLAPIIEAAGARCAASVVGWTTGVLGRLLVHAGGTVAEQLLPGVCDGSLQVALPLADPSATARQVTVAGGALHAELIVHGAAEPTGLLLPLTTDDGPVLGLLTSAQIALARVECVDKSRFLHRATISGVELSEVTTVPVAGSHHLLRTLVAQVAALDAVGATRSALSATIDYSLERHQFGRAIGSFQAYKHRCANAYQMFTLAQSGAFRAAQDEDDTLALATALAGIPDCIFVCGDAVQLHGAIGFSWETGLHRYLLRARSAGIIASAGDEVTDALLRHTRSAPNCCLIQLPALLTL